LRWQTTSASHWLSHPAGVEPNLWQYFFGFSLFWFDEIFARYTEQHQQRAGNQYRGVDAEQDADGQRHGEIVQRFAAEEQHRADHHLRATVRDDGARHGTGNGIVNDHGHFGLAHGAEVFTDTIEHHHRFVDRITQHRQHRRQHRERELPLEKGEETENDHHVMQVGDNGGQAEFPREAQPQITDDTKRHQQQRQLAVVDQVFADLRADEFHAAHFHAGILLAQACHDLFAELGSGEILLERHLYQHVIAGTEILHQCIRQTRLGELRTYLGEIGRLCVMHLHHRAAGEIHSEIQSLGGKKKYRKQKRHQRNRGGIAPITHERNVVPDPEKFHVFYSSLFLLSQLSPLGGESHYPHLPRAGEG